jgi:sialate O-acetylesterase
MGITHSEQLSRACGALGVFLLLSLFSASPLSAEIRLARVFSSNMVLQQQQPLTVWGVAGKGEAVTVAIAGQRVRTTANASGEWMVQLQPLAMSKTPLTMTVKGTTTLTLTNILVGEVWLCSGQSNMEFGIKVLKNGAKEVAAADHPGIRLFYVPVTLHPFPRKELPASCRWRVCSPESIALGSHMDKKAGKSHGFSGTAYYFGRELHKQLDGVPIGLIQSAWGGTLIEPWTPPEGFASEPELSDIHNKLEQTIAKARGIELYRSPTTIYNAMIHPLIPFRIRGAIWYQGEANVGEGMLYHTKKRALIHGWRTLWDIGDFPFYYAQLAPFHFNWRQPQDLPELWEAQVASLSIKNTGMAVTSDISTINDIHPPNKQEVGRRLALIALARDYGKKLVYSGPIFKSTTEEGSKLRVHFSHTGSGLISRDGKPLTWFKVAGADMKFVDAKAVIDGHAVVLSSANVAKPEYVTFAWRNIAEPNLMNKEGLPASAFRKLPVNLARGKPYVCDAPNPFNFGIGGLTDGSWALNNVRNCFATDNVEKWPKNVTVNLQRTHKIDTIRFGVPPYGATKDVTVSISADNKRFTEVAKVSFQQGKQQARTVAVNGASAVFVRLTYTGQHGKTVGYKPGFAFTTELEVYGE